MLTVRPYTPFLVFAHAVLAFAGSKSDMHWQLDFGTSWNEAKEQARPVLVEVWADWCAPCKRMNAEVWGNAKVIEAAKNFVQISLDVSRRNEGRLGAIPIGSSRAYMVRALPTVVILDPWGETLDAKEGFVYPSDLVAMLSQIPPDYSSVRAEREALISHRDNSRALAQLGLLYQRGSAFELANRYYREALSGSGTKEDERRREGLKFGIAMNEVRLADWRAARKHLEEFRIAYPASTLMDQVLFGFVVADVRQNKMQDAKQHAAELRSSFPNSNLIAMADHLLEERGAARH
jgi:thiol-disulfide isomerase/thioredoxin